MFKKHIQKKLEKYVVKYFKKHQPKLVAVVGAVGKTTTKTAIATVLSAKFRVGMEPENHNTEISAPLAILGIEYPPVELLRKVGTWRRIFAAARKRIKWPASVDVIVQELGTERPGEIPHFGEYLRPDIAVVTAVAPEHMENFPNGLIDVAREELSVAKFSNLTVVNRDDIDMSFAPLAETTNITNYGLNEGEYRFEMANGAPLTGYAGRIFGPEFGENGLETTIHLVGDHNVKAAIAAACIGAKLGMTPDEIAAAIPTIQPVAGRMNILRGVRESTIIDDTYNSSPTAAVEALRTLYQIEAPQRIAILGSMKELGAQSPKYHAEIGEICDPLMLGWVITIGEDAARYLAPAARKKGNQVASFPDPISAGAFANKVLEKGGVVLAKGSQNGVFAEEAVKILLAHAEDAAQLVRQSSDWMNKTNTWIQDQDTPATAQNNN